MEALWSRPLTLGRIAAHYKGKVAVTWVLLLGEAVLILLFPLAIGMAVDALLADDVSGIYFLVGLCVLVMFFGAGRRFYDTRAYSAIYHELGTFMVERQMTKGESTSTVSARIALLNEVVEFLEEYLPELLGGVVAFVGVLLLLGSISPPVMVLCLIVSFLILAVYWFSERRIFSYNANQNDELERRVTVLESGRRRDVDRHFKRLVRWKIRLSDLETLNFSVVWIFLAALLIASTVMVTTDEAISYGQKVTSIMYVFQYLEVVMAFPFIFQQFVRLREITARLSRLGE